MLTYNTRFISLYDLLCDLSSSRLQRNRAASWVQSAADRPFPFGCVWIEREAPGDLDCVRRGADLCAIGQGWLGRGNAGKRYSLKVPFDFFFMCSVCYDFYCLPRAHLCVFSFVIASTVLKLYKHNSTVYCPCISINLVCILICNSIYHIYL